VDLPGEPPTSQVLRSSEGQRRRATVTARRSGEKGRRREALRSGPEEGRVTADEGGPVRFGALGSFHPAQGAAVPSVACRFLRGPGGARVREGSGGFEDPRLGRSESLEGTKTRRAAATRRGACPGSVRTDSKRDQRFETGEAGGGGDPGAGDPGRPGSGASASWKGDP
jgi:hypothetical protein